MTDRTAYWQRRYRRHLAAGKCWQCDQPRNPAATLCDPCLEGQRVRHREAGGFDPWHPGGQGRPPKARTA